MPVATKPDLNAVADTAALLREVDSLRGALRLAMETIRRLKRCQNVDTAPVLRMLARSRIEAQRVAEDISQRN